MAMFMGFHGERVHASADVLAEHAAMYIGCVTFSQRHAALFTAEGDKRSADACAVTAGMYARQAARLAIQSIALGYEVAHA